MNNEIWKDINGFEGFYQVSNLGNVRSLDRILITESGYKLKYKGKIFKLKPYILKTGRPDYIKVSLQANNKKLTTGVHRLVALAFLDNPENKPEVNHKDQNRSNNRLENLEWVTKEENMKHAKIEGKLGSRNGNSILDEYDVKNICNLLSDSISYTNKEIISRLQLNISESSIEDIRNKKYWKHLECVQNLPEHSKQQVKLNEKDIENICKLLEEGKTSTEIVSILNLPVNPRMIRKIRNKTRWIHLECVQNLNL